MTGDPQNQRLSLGEFVTLMAILTSLLALSIDAMLPALPDIGAELGVESENHTQLVVTTLFFGFAVGQILFGPLSDSIGRKPAVYIGLAIFILGDIISIMSTSFPMMLFGRVLQGFGVAGPRVVTIALVRDQFEGREMARIMSLIMMVFIIVPTIAPSLGQGILYVAPWRYIFGFILCLAVISFVWFAKRQAETLPASRRSPYSLIRILLAIRETCTNRMAFGYTLAAGLIFGAFVGYLSSSQQIFQIQYQLADLFPIYFGSLAIAIGAASYFNSRMVLRYGMRRLSWRALQALCTVSALFYLFTLSRGGVLPLPGFMLWGALSFFSIGILFGNFNALAIEPLGHIAGTAAAVIGSLTTLISVALGIYIGHIYSGTVLPLIGSFALLGMASMAVMLWTERGKIDG
jgi:MFS transporter, DHA1 family, multidrug resistance protein